MLIIRLIIFNFLLLIILSTGWTKTETSKTSFHNIELSTLHQAKLIGPVNSKQIITFTVWLKLRNQEQLDRLVNEIYDPHSDHFQKFLTKEVYDANYAPNTKASNEVENYFVSQGMKTKRLHHIIQVTASAEKIEQVLQVKLNNYRYKNRLVYGNLSAPKINADIAQYISAISDLSNIPYGHPNVHQQSKLVKFPSDQPIEELHFAWDSFLPTATPTTTSLQGFTGQQLRTGYNLANVAPINNTLIDGTGETIVIIDGCGTGTPADIMDDANHYSIANSLPLLTANNFAVVNYQGEPYIKGSMRCHSTWDGEIALDVEASHTMAPGANIVLVMTEDVNNTQVAIAIDTITSQKFSIANFPNAYVVSNSWDNNDDARHEPLDSTLQTATAMGLSINFAAGDCGDQTYHSDWPCPKLGRNPSIQYPVSSSYVTAVAGTSLFVDNNYNYAFESGWGNYLDGLPYSGSMGGISKYRPFPSWQTPISDFIAGGYGTVGNHNRAIPDIAMVADFYTGLIIYQGSFYKTGGASQSTPLFSGVLTLVNQARAVLNRGVQNPIGLAAPYFYTYNNELINSRALNLVSPPHQIISGATPVNNAPVDTTPPNYAFNLPVDQDTVTFNWDGVLSIIEEQFWNDVVGVGSPNVPNFVSVMARL